MTSFVHRKIDLTFTLATGTFNNQDADTVKLTGLRVLCEIDMPGGAGLNGAKLRIYGMKQDDMNRLTVLAWTQMGLSKNTVQIDVGDDVSGTTTLFIGDIYNAYGDYQGAPDVAFVVEAWSGLVDKAKPVAADSFNGSVPVLTIYQSIAKQLNATLENNNVTGTITDMYLSGTPIEKLRRLSDAAKVDFYYIPPTLAICPRGEGRQNGPEEITINANNGMVGWPIIDRMGIGFTTLFNPGIQHGGKVKIESSITGANGSFYVYSMSHRLESERPGGAWFSHILATQQQSAIRL